MPEDYKTIKSQVQAARSQLDIQRRTVETEEERIRKQERLLAALRTRKPQRKLGFQRDPRYSQQLQRFLAEEKFKREQSPSIEEAKKKIREYRKSLSPYESQILKAEGQIRAYEIQVARQQKAIRKFAKLRREKYEELGLEPIYTGGKITGFSDSKIQMSYTLENLPAILQTYRPGDIAAFKSAGLVMVKDAPTLEKISLAYKDPITSQMFSAAPGKESSLLKKGFVPVAVTPTGEEAPFAEQIELRAKRPELFETDILEGYRLVERPPMQETIGAPTQALVPKYEPTKVGVKEVWEGFWKAEEVAAKGAIGIGRKAFEETIGYVPEFYYKMPTAKDLIGFGYTAPITVGKPPKAEWEIAFEKKQEKFKEEVGVEVGKDIAELSIQEKVEPEFTYLQSEYDTRWGGKIAAGEITHEEAVKKFEQSDFYKGAMVKFNRRIQEEYEEAKVGKKPTKRDIKILAYGGLGAIPTRIDVPTGIVRGAEVVAVLGLMRKFPKATGAYIFGYRLPKSVYTFVSPKTVPAEKLMSAVELAAITGIGIYAGVRYARAPVLTTQEIAVAPRLKEIEKGLRISPALERQVFTMEGEAKFVKDLHKMAKLDEQVITGRRTIVTTKIRKRLGLKEVYGGIPYSQPKAYREALKRLQSYGATEVEARAALRYYQPRALMSEMKGVAEVVYGTAMPKPEIHIRKAARVTTPEQRIIDEALGIKTRVGKRKVEYIAAKGKEIGIIDDVTLYKFITRTEEALLTRAGRPFTPIRKAGKVTTTYEQISGVKPEAKVDLGEEMARLERELYKSIGKREPAIYGYKPIPVKIFKEASLIKQIIPPKRKITKAKGRVIVEKELEQIPITTFDIEEIAGLRVRKIPTFKEPAPTPKLNVKDLIKDLEDIYGRPAKRPKKIVTAWDRKRHERRVKELRTYLQDLSGKERAEIAKTARDIYGEPVIKVTPMAQIEKQIMKDVIKRPPPEAIAGAIPKVKPMKDIIKDVSKIETKLYEKVGVKEKLRLGVGVAAREKERLREASRLGQQMSQITKQALKESLQLGQPPRLQQRMKQAQRMQLKQALLPKQLLKTVLTPSVTQPFRFKTPPPTKVTTPIFPFPDIDISKEVLKRKIRKGKRRERVYTYNPSFSARALGMAPIKLETETSVKKLMKKMLTGLEVRTPVVRVR